MKRTTKRRLTNGILYGILVLAVVLLGALVDWSAVKANFFDPAGWKRGGNWGDLIKTGVKNTVVYTLIAFAFGFALAIVLALMKLSPVAPYRWLATGVHRVLPRAAGPDRHPRDGVRGPDRVQLAARRAA